MTSADENETLQATRDWLAERERAGNWYDIAPTDEIPCDVAPQFRTILHMFQLAFGPELRKHLAEGTIDDRFVLRMAQLLQFLGLEDFELDPSELDAGHFTLFWLDGQWRAVFDFRVGRAKAGNLLDAAAEFLAAARFSSEQRHARASTDNLFSASELAAKARLILVPGRRPLKRHKAAHSALNLWSRYGNVDAQFTKLFNRLCVSRRSARYEAAQVAPPSQEDIALVEAEIVSLTKQVAHRMGN